MEPDHGKIKNNGGKEMAKVIFQIVLLDIVFSFDSILTAVGLSNQLAVMIIAVVISMIVMMLYAGKISKVIASHPTLEILALSFLILIGFMLVLEGVHIEVPKGYIYFAVFFALIIELVNIRIRKKHTK
jgi:predicted tellurium resistance membrane protein TerC